MLTSDMDFFGAGIPIGQWRGITVRLHFTLLFYAIWQITSTGNIVLGLVFMVGLFGCVLLHEFGHALAARWCDGETDEIVLWPLGGLAMARPSFSPTAYLITTIAGPFVTFLLWLGFSALAWLLGNVVRSDNVALVYIYLFVIAMQQLNLVLLVFNFIPAFPMDGGRIVRDALWYGMSCETATTIAVWISRGIAGLAVLAWAISDLAPGLRYDIIMVLGRPALFVFDWTQSWWTLLLAGFIIVSTWGRRQHIGLGGASYGFSIRDRLKRGNRQRAFRQGVKARMREEEATAFHRCAVCGRTEKDSPHAEFRVCSDCSTFDEYCQDHINNHQHK